jgi:hypothetical protein
MGASATIDQQQLSVDPGQQVSAKLRVRNNGTVVDQFTFEALGAGAAWITVEPDNVSLFPGAEETVTVMFRPPRVATTPPGPTPFGVKVNSREEPDGSAVEEGVLTVGHFAERTVELFPLTARGRRSGKFELAIDNRGNAPILVDLAGSDAEDACTYRFSADADKVEPGSARFVKLRVSPRKRFWKGPPKTHQFQVVVSERAPVVEPPAGSSTEVDLWAPPGAESPSPTTAATAPSAAVAVAEAPAIPVAAPEVVNGSLLQEALVPPWLIKAIIAAIALLLVLWLLWITLFKSTVESAARDAVAEPIADLTARVDEVAPTTVPPPTLPGGGTVPGGGDGTGTTVPGGGDGTGTTVPGGGDGTGTTVPGGGTSTGGFATPFGDPADFQLGNASSVGAGASQAFPQPFTAQFSLTDFVLQNPAGDTGRVEISRDGTVLFTSALENFRDLDQHFVAPYVFKTGQNLTMTVTCTTPGPGAAGCSVSASFAGFTK